jgi:hemoglobin/transferrin/lactoferrin receptor protein
MIPRGQEKGGDALGSIPADRLNLTLGFRPFADVEVGGRATFARGQDDVPDGAEATGGYSVFDLFASWRPAPGAVLRAGIDNIFDRDYRVHPNGLPDPGRSLKIAASFSF